MLGMDIKSRLFTPPPPTLHEHKLYDVTSGFAQIFMTTKFVCHGLSSQFSNEFENVNLIFFGKSLEVGDENLHCVLKKFKK